MNGLIILPRGSNMSKMSENLLECGTARDLSHFISKSPWSAERVMRLNRINAVKLLGPGGSLIIDESGQQKYGKHAVATSKQYLGTVGRTCNAQVEVFGSYCVGQNSAIIDFQVFFTESWVNNTERSLNSGTPLELLEHRTKPDLALDIVDRAISDKIPFTYVQADALYGNDSKFLGGLEERGLTFICDIASDTQVYITKPELELPKRKGNVGRFPSKLKVKNTSQTKVKWLSEIQKNWKTVDIRLTDRGIKNVECAELIVWRRHNDLPVEKPVKLIMIRDLKEDFLRFAVSNSLEFDLEYLVKAQAKRYWIERNFEDVKGLCDLDSFRGRSWTSLNHHIALCVTAHLFLLHLKEYFRKKSKILSLNQIVAIVRLHKPLKVFTTQELADLINRTNLIRAKMRDRRIMKFIRKRYEKENHWSTNILEFRTKG
ncbi:IS701 family transposase [Methanoplanus endosymbiosus]|uniref:IS701 family transposase n=1 Tax=Methanoplanus endosymbiosus TaxID=33865 RepID=A0A9E7PP88_9EURY|nr:IS701 family transposase [Methanoplanus endosymbiosus]UUX93901.1 IS701 family transposase [Methanoplanus endosymbiosus]UUX93904.1 IS701 family transposase [Methanoplanus endosymbiosus]